MSSRLKAWETGGIGGLYDLPRSGAPPELTEAGIEITGEFTKEHPDSPKIIPAESIEKTCGKFGMSSSKRIIKKLRMRRKRVRKTVGKKRDPEKYEKNRKEIEKPEEQRKAGISDSYFPDRTGFSSGSSVPYAYQPIGETPGIPSSGGGRPDVTGFHSTDNSTGSFCFKNTIHAGVISACSDEFSEMLIKKLMYLPIILRCITVRNSGRIFRDGGKESYISDIYRPIRPDRIRRKPYGNL